MPSRILARRRAFLLLTVGLNNVDLAIFGQRAFNEIVEPSFRQFPAFLAGNPNRRRSSIILKPLAIRFCEGKSNAQALPSSRPPQYDRYPLPDIVQRQFVHILSNLFDRRMTLSAVVKLSPMSRQSLKNSSGASVLSRRYWRVRSRASLPIGMTSLEETHCGLPTFSSNAAMTSSGRSAPNRKYRR